MSEIVFKDEFHTDHGTFNSVFGHAGCRLRFEGGSERREVGVYAKRQDTATAIKGQKTGVASWDMLDPNTASEQVWDDSRWKHNGLEIFSGSEEPKPRRLSDDEQIPRTTPPRKETGPR
jgi:hypothetical protein